MRVPNKVHMTRLARSLVILDSNNSKRPKPIPISGSTQSFPVCPVCQPKGLFKPQKRQGKGIYFPRKVKACSKSSGPPGRLQTVPENTELVVNEQPVVPEQGEPAFQPSLDAVREVVQIRMIIRRMLTDFGEATVTEFIERMNSPLPTVDLIFTEELHNYWIGRGDFHRLPVDDAGNRLAAFPAPEWGIVNVNEGTETIWTSPYASILRKLAFVDLTTSE